MNNYKTSKDYTHLKALLDAGQEIVCFTTFALGNKRKDDPNHFPFMVCDVCRAHKVEASGRYVISSRDFEYAVYHPSMYCYSSFEHMCQEHNIEFLDPDKPIHPNLVTELKQYLATTPPEQQQRDWEQIKAEIPDAGQVPVIFYGLSGSTSHTSTTVTPIDPDEDPVKAQAQMKFQEVSYIHSKLVGCQALLDFEQFLSLARYFSTYSLNMVLAETERRIFELKSGWLEKKFNDSYGGGALDYLTHILVYIKSLLSAPKLTHSVTKKTDQVIKNDNLENELQSLLKESGVTTDYVHQDFLRVVASHFAAYGKDQFLKAMKENHVDTI